jgi:O-antigen/teichoic acid export membrane protein
MPVETIPSKPVIEPSQKSTFFRQSGWMMIATVVGGVFMAGVHGFSKALAPMEYSAMGTLLQLLNLMTIPALGLQMVFAQQASAAVTETQRQQLVSTVRAVMRWTFCIWLATAVVTIVCHNTFIAALQLSNPAALWVTLVVGLVMLWFPIFQGLLQGRQNFLWLGWGAIFNGVGRVGIVGVIVIVFHGGAAGVMGGVLIGLLVAWGIGVWQNLDLRKEPGAAFDAAGWLRRVVPMTLGFGAFQFLASADALVAQNYLGKDGGAAAYFFGGTLARAIPLLTVPLAAVMFPKLVHSAALSQKSNLMGVTLLGTAVLGGVGALGLTLTAPLLIKIGSKPEYVSIVPLIPLFGWVMVPLSLGNVLLYNLMAHSRFKVVPALVVVATGYWVALQYHHDSFKMIIQTLGVFSLIFLAVCLMFSWISKDKTNEANEN